VGTGSRRAALSCPLRSTRTRGRCRLSGRLNPFGGREARGFVDNATALPTTPRVQQKKRTIDVLPNADIFTRYGHRIPPDSGRDGQTRSRSSLGPDSESADCRPSRPFLRWTCRTGYAVGREESDPQATWAHRRLPATSPGPPTSILKFRTGPAPLWIAAYLITRLHLLRVRLSALAGSEVHRMMAANGCSLSETSRPCVAPPSNKGWALSGHFYSR
jgi:hypothetical protein